MELVGAASSAIRDALSPAASHATVLGSSRHALYLATGTSPGVIAVLAYDAVRLPCALVLPTTSMELPLSDVAPSGPYCLVGDGMVRWAGPDGPITVTATREWAPRRVRPGLVDEAALAHVRAVLTPLPEHEVGAGLIAPLAIGSEGTAGVAGLLGRGCGLTPAGDDVLAGFLVGARAFGQDVRGIAGAVTRLAPERTTALSAALLWHAARGQCIDEMAALASALTGRGDLDAALSRLLAVGHTSGAAVACGLVAAAKAAHAGRLAA